MKRKDRVCSVVKGIPRNRAAAGGGGGGLLCSGATCGNTMAPITRANNGKIELAGIRSGNYSLEIVHGDLFSRFTIHFFFSNKIFHLLLSEYFPPVVLISREIFPLLESIGGEIGFAIKRQMSTTSPCSPFIPYNL